MTEFNISLRGDHELDKMLRELPERLERRVTQGAMRRAGRIVLEAARANLDAIGASATGRKRTKRKQRRRTNIIKQGLKLRALPKRRGRRRSTGIAVFTPTRIEAGIRADDPWYYPAHIELGTKRTAALSFLRPALADNEKTVLQRLEQELRVGLRREVERG